MEEKNNMNKTKILLLDDSDIQRTKLQELFSAQEGFEIVGTTNDGKEGLKMFKELSPDLVLMDIVLQNYDGFEFLEQIKETSDKHAKILVLSSLKGEDFANKSIELGASYYMIKPIADEVLLKRINALLIEEEGKVKILKPLHTRALDEKLSNVFITVGIPAHIKGYQFLREAIKMAIDEPDIINSITKQLYPSIADKFSTSASKVERAIRHAIEVAWNRGKIENINALFGIKVYNSNEKPTNGEFIALVADKMLIEGA